ncbi:MAG: hypothetical protein LQ351_002885 [Letrouitia transgressa]|nr:MAG: hypothetical protein LQ351_002885 [Letrouitia transgressa]
MSKNSSWTSRRYYWPLEYEDNAQQLPLSKLRLRRSGTKVEECIRSVCPTSGLDSLCKMKMMNESSIETCRLCWPDSEDASKVEERRKFCKAIDNLAHRSIWAIGGIGLGLLLISIAALLVSQKRLKRRRNSQRSDPEDPRLLRPGRRPPLGGSANRAIPEESENDLAGEAKPKPWYSRLWLWSWSNKRHPEEIRLELADPYRRDRAKRERLLFDGAHNSTSSLDSRRHAKRETVRPIERSADATGHEARGSRTTRRSRRSNTTLEEEITPMDGTSPRTQHCSGATS